jgi:hypothetical protein
MNTSSCFAVLAVVLAAAPVAKAQPAPTFEAGKAADVKDVKDVTWTAKGEAGLLATTGNSKATTVTAGASASRKDKDNKLELVFSAAYARATTRVASDANGNGAIDAGELSTASATSVENAMGKLRYDRYLTALDSFYLAALGAIDKVAGKDFQGGGQVGYSRSLYTDKTQQALAELGYDLSHTRLSAGTSTTIQSLRAFVGYKNQLNKVTAFEASVEGLFNINAVTIGARHASAFEDTRVNGTVSATTALSTKISVSASFALKYDHLPAPLASIGGTPFAADFAPIADTTDTITKVSLIFNFL